MKPFNMVLYGDSFFAGAAQVYSFFLFENVRELNGFATYTLTDGY